MFTGSFASSQQGLLACPVAASIRPSEFLLTLEMAERAFPCLWTYFQIKHGQVLLWDCQVPLTRWVSYIFEVSALQWDFAEFDVLVLQRKTLGASRRKCGEKSNTGVFKRWTSGSFCSDPRSCSYTPTFPKRCRGEIGKQLWRQQQAGTVRVAGSWGEGG